MTRNTALRETIPLPDTLAGRSIVLVGLMGAGKTSIGRRLAARLGLPFHDADAEIELAAGCSIPELFARYGEPAFRDGERRVIRRLLAGDPIVLAFGGGAFMDPETRATTRAEAVSVWLRCPLNTLVHRVAGREHRPLLANGDREETLRRPRLPQKRAVVVTDESVARLHLPTLMAGLEQTAVTASQIVVRNGEASKNLD